MYSTRGVLEVLAKTRKRVITNLPLNLGNVRDYLLGKHGDDFDAAGRVRILDTQETGNFWLFFGQGEQLDPAKRILFKTGGKKELTHQSFAQRFEAMRAAATQTRSVGPGTEIESELERWIQPVWDGGICYVIDEAHEHFNARAWAETGSDALHYLSQHRKVGDEVYFVTQHVRNVDTQLRRVAQDFTYVRNLRKVKSPIFFGLFKAPPLFVSTCYLDEKTGTAQDVQEMRTFTLDVSGIGTCYDTAAGVGVMGSGADKGSAAKGVPFWVLPFVIGAICLLVIGGVWAANRVWVHHAKEMMKAPVPGVIKEAPAVQRPTDSTPVASVPRAPQAPSVGETNKPVRLVGWAYIPTSKTVWAYLSDGRTLTRGWHFTGAESIEFEGRNYAKY